MFNVNHYHHFPEPVPCPCAAAFQDLRKFMADANQAVLDKLAEVMTHVTSLEARDATTKQLLADLKDQLAKAGSLSPEVNAAFANIDNHLDAINAPDAAPATT
jgi:hypothetical protein